MAKLKTNRQNATSAIRELAMLEALGQLDDEPAGTEGELGWLNLLLIECALLNLVRHKLHGKAGANAFHPRSHITLQLSADDEAWNKRLAITFSAVESEKRGGVEYTLKRALVYDPSEPEGRRFYVQRRHRPLPRPVGQVTMTNGEPEYSLHDAIEMEQEPDPVPAGELLRVIRLLAESNPAHPQQSQ